MQLTEEQQLVVDIKDGRHLILAPPGSGKTEMLTQRVVSALKSGVNSDRMFCVTFTVRAGVEMRERVKAAVTANADLKGVKIPDIGNIHHFCNRLLVDNKLIPENKKVVDEIAQRELLKDVWVQLKKELKEYIKRPEATTDPQIKQMLLDLYQEEKQVDDVINVLDAFTPNKPAGMIDRDYYAGLLSHIEATEDNYLKKKKSVFPELVVASARYRRQKMGVPYSLLRPIPEDLYELRNDGLLPAISSAYQKLKDRFGALDFDDLITESYLALKEGRVLKEESRFEWIQVDEVQDLNAMQWEIVQMVSRNDATSVFFGDAEQTIFSFMGASAERLARVGATCSVHYFRKNFRATPYLLDILIRYSLKVLRSKWMFLPRPCDSAPKFGQLYCGRGNIDKAVDIATGWIANQYADDVAILVRRNSEADTLEQIIQSRKEEIRYVKVSGVEIFELSAMRDFMSFCTLLNDGGSLLGWGRMFRRFSGVKQDNVARRLVKTLVDTGLTPQEFLKPNENCSLPFTKWMNERVCYLRERLSWLWNEAQRLLDETSSYRELFNRFENTCWQAKLFGVLDYVTIEEKEQYERSESRKEGHLVVMPLHVAREHFLRRVEKFFRYLDKKYENLVSIDSKYAQKKLRERMNQEWREILQLREADLIVGDEQLIISTIHKAKGRQFSGVIIPNCQREVFPSKFATSYEELDEEARVLYVALSRAKRHLALCYSEEPSPFIKCIQSCFSSDFINLFCRLRKENNESLNHQSKDWLFDYNELLDARLEKRFLKEKVENILSLSNSGDVDLVLRRIAVATLYLSEDEKYRNEYYRKELSVFLDSREKGDIAKEVLKGIATLRLVDFVNDNTVRSLFLNSIYAPVKDEIHFAILKCYEDMLKSRELTLDDVFTNNLIEEITDCSRENIKLGIEDALFSNNGDVRLEAARLIKENFEDSLGIVLDGSDNDWKVLPSILSPKRIRVLKWMLKNNRHKMPEGKWRSDIEKLINNYSIDTSDKSVKKNSSSSDESISSEVNQVDSSVTNQAHITVLRDLWRSFMRCVKVYDGGGK